MKVKIDIDTQTFIRFGLVILGFVASIYVLILIKTPLTIIAMSLFLALALNPPVTRIARRMPGRSRVGATAVAYLLVVAALVAVVVLIVPPVVQQSSKFAESVPGLIDQLTAQRSSIDGFLEAYGLQESVDQGIENAKAQAASIAANLGNVLVGLASSVIGGATTLVFVLVLAFLMLIEGPQWMGRIWGLYRDPDLLERHKSLVHKMYRVVTGYVNGQIVVAAIAAASSLATILILSTIFDMPINIALPLAATIFVTGLIPMFGATIGAILVGIVLLLNSPVAAAIFIVYFIIYQQIENNFISPTIQSKTVELSPLAILSAVLIGLTLFGVLGGVISIPIAGMIRVAVTDYLDHARRARSDKRSKNPLKRLATKVKEST